MTQFVMLVRGYPGEEEPTTNRYLKASDPDYRADGLAQYPTGLVELTHVMEDARRFDTIGALFECWKEQSIKVPLRPDGKPNRPLTAYTITPVPLSLEDQGETAQPVPAALPRPLPN